MTALYELTAQCRTEMGKRASRRMRRGDQIPAVLYGGGQAPLALSIDHNQVVKALKQESFYSHIITLHIDGKKSRVILKSLQHHPYKPKYLHMDFQRVSEKEAINVRVPLHFLNEASAKGVKKEGGMVTHHKTEVEVSCLPADLPEYIEVELIDLALGQSLHLSDLPCPKGVTFAELTHGAGVDHPVVSIVAMRTTADEPSEEEISPEVPTGGEEGTAG